MLTLYDNVWYLFEKFGKFFPIVKRSEEKQNWINHIKRLKL